MITDKMKNEISELIDMAEDDFKWGGSEDSEGCLMPGDVDFEKLKKDIFKVLKGENNDNT